MFKKIQSLRFIIMSIQNSVTQKALYAPLSIGIDQENVNKRKESIALVLSAFGGE